MILRGTYVNGDAGRHAPCPFCGSEDTDLRPGGKYSYDQVYCNGCLTEFTFYPPAGEHRVGGPKLGETVDRWDGRADPDPGWCPFCGCDGVEFEGVMNYSQFFADAYCLDCKVRFEFQRVKKGKNDANNVRKARAAFGRRV